jgi:ParB family chromosome partitioning protein
MRETFSEIERENEALRARLGEGEQVVELDPDLVDPSFCADRFSTDEDLSFAALKASMAERGQEIPILVRPRGERFQAAYGHRRLRAAQQLQRRVKAIVRDLSDDDLVIAQGLENSAREDLSFIERAVFALRLEESGRDRALIAQALAVDKAEASKLITVARGVPREIAQAIGKAAKAGRPRWLEFAEALKTPAAVERVRAALAAPGFAAAPPDTRFVRALAAAKHSAGAPEAALSVLDAKGQSVATVRGGPRDVRVALKGADGRRFAAFLAGRLPLLLREFGETEGEAE